MTAFFPFFIFAIVSLSRIGSNAVIGPSASDVKNKIFVFSNFVFYAHLEYPSRNFFMRRCSIRKPSVLATLCSQTVGLCNYFSKNMISSCLVTSYLS